MAEKPPRPSSSQAGLDRMMRRSEGIATPVRSLLGASIRLTGAIEDAVGPTGLTTPQFSVLMELAATPDGRLSLCEIGRRCMKSPPNITAIVDRVESAGLVRRARDQADRRIVQAELTDAGWRVLRAAAPPALAAQRQALEALTRAERAALTELLDRVAR